MRRAILVGDQVVEQVFENHEIRRYYCTVMGRTKWTGKLRCKVDYVESGVSARKGIPGEWRTIKDEDVEYHNAVDESPYRFSEENWIKRFHVKPEKKKKKS